MCVQCSAVFRYIIHEERRVERDGRARHLLRRFRFKKIEIDREEEEEVTNFSTNKLLIGGRHGDETRSQNGLPFHQA